MKKYALSLSAIILAIVLSAYTKPIRFLTSKQFRYTSSNFTQFDVINLSNWIQDPSAFTCDGDLTCPCTILVNQDYYHYDEEGVAILNGSEQDFDSPNDQVMIIKAELGNLANIYRVSYGLAPMSTIISRDNRSI